MVIHIFRRHICLANSVRMIALPVIDQRITWENVEPFIQEIKIYAGEGKELSEEIKKLKDRINSALVLTKGPLISLLESQEGLQSSQRQLSLQGPVRLPHPPTTSSISSS